MPPSNARIRSAVETSSLASAMETSVLIVESSTIIALNALALECALATTGKHIVTSVKSIIMLAVMEHVAVAQRARARKDGECPEALEASSVLVCKTSTATPIRGSNTSNTDESY